MKLNKVAYPLLLLLAGVLLYVIPRNGGFASLHFMSDAAISATLLGCGIALLIWRSAIIDSLADSRVAVVKILSNEEMSAQRIKFTRIIYSIGIIFAAILFIFTAYATYVGETIPWAM